MQELPAFPSCQGKNDDLVLLSVTVEGFQKSYAPTK